MRPMRLHLSSKNLCLYTTRTQMRLYHATNFMRQYHAQTHLLLVALNLLLGIAKSELMNLFKLGPFCGSQNKASSSFFHQML